MRYRAARALGTKISEILETFEASTTNRRTVGFGVPAWNRKHTKTSITAVYHKHQDLSHCTVQFWILIGHKVLIHLKRLLSLLFECFIVSIETAASQGLVQHRST